MIENSRKTVSLTYTNFVRIVRDDVQDRKFAKFFKFVRTRILYVLFVCTYLTALVKIDQNRLIFKKNGRENFPISGINSGENSS